MAILYIVATPLGNLDDITTRAINTLKEVDLILCEDTRRTLKLLASYEIKIPLLSYHYHSKESKIEKILEALASGKKIALVSDAGTPAISDPGSFLIKKIIEKFNNSVEIIPIPGCSAVTTIASISGFPVDRFLFLGFPPVKKKRKAFFDEVASSEYPVIIYESPHRIIRTVNELLLYDKDREIVIGRELTKKFETVYRGTIGDVLSELKRSTLKGEFVIILKSL